MATLNENTQILDGAMKKALEITSSFEGTGYTRTAGNFDGMGISYGLLSWNIGKGTLQPLLKKMYTEYPNKFKTACTVYVDTYKKIMDLSTALLDMCNLTPQEGVKWAIEREIKISTTNWKLLPHWVKVFENLGLIEEFKEIQREVAYLRFKLAKNYCIQFNLKTERALALFYDCCVQQGSLLQTTIKRILTRIPEKSYQQKLVIIAEEMKNQTSQKWSADVYSRRHCIALGIGVVHGKPYNLSKDYGLSDAALIL